MITPEQIYNATDSGLDIIKHFYTGTCAEGVAKENGTGKKFKIREGERTPSASLKKIKGRWVVTDWGDDSEPRDGIAVTMKELNLNFKKAILWLAAKYGIHDESIKESNRAKRETRRAEPDEKEGDFNFEDKEFSEYELQVFGSPVTKEVCKKYNYKSLAWYSQTKKNEKDELITTTVSSTETYPIFMLDCGEFKKIYKPLEWEKQYRFSYTGKKPKDYINGLLQLRAARDKYVKDNSSPTVNEDTKEIEDKPKKDKYPEAIICSGERDALCCAGLGYYPLWFNSETSNITNMQFRDISNLAEKVYIVPDLDSTGIRAAINLALRFLELRIIWLNPDIKNYPDARGRPRKDLRDFIEMCSGSGLWDFNDLVKKAMPLQFWEVNKEGYKINTEYLLHFLKCKGFGLYEDKAGKHYVYISNDNKVKEVDAPDIRRHVRQFLKANGTFTPIINFVNNAKLFNANTFDLLDNVQPDFCQYGENYQHFFFDNAAVRVGTSGVDVQRGSNIDKHVWEDNVIKHFFRRINPAFEITGTDTDKWDINIKSRQSKFFCYLMNTSRFHWRTELETRLGELPESKQQEYLEKHRYSIDGDLLTIEEIAEQKLHLINKIFAIGYLLHRYKYMQRAWCVYLMDGRVTTADEDANGRSGKSFFIHAISRLLNTETLSGNKFNTTDNNHLYDRVTEKTELVFVDEASKYLDIGFFFNVITGDWIINPKNRMSYVIPFSQAPKTAISTNYAPRRNDPSTEGRLLYVLFSDYYHVRSDNNNYKEDRSIADDFGGKQLLMNDYPVEDRNADYNFMIDCLHFYLSVLNRNLKIQPPMQNIQQRVQIETMSSQFIEWAYAFFDPDNRKLDTYVLRSEAYEDFIAESKSKSTPQKFGKSLKAFCKYKKYVLNPSILPGYNDGRIIRKVETGNKTAEYFYIQTKEVLSPEQLNIISNDNISDNLKPF